jgi:Transmembrane secretion effector
MARHALGFQPASSPANFKWTHYPHAPFPKTSDPARGVFEDVAVEGRFLETFLVDSWLDHLRQHERTTNADRVVEDGVNRFHAEGTPKVTHFVAPARNERL